MRGLLDILSLALGLGSVSQTNIPLKGYKVVCEAMTQLLSFLNKDLLFASHSLCWRHCVALPEDCSAVLQTPTGLLEVLWNNAVDEMRRCAVQSGHQLVQLLLEQHKEEWSEKTNKSY